MSKKPTRRGRRSRHGSTRCARTWPSQCSPASRCADTSLLCAHFRGDATWDDPDGRPTQGAVDLLLFNPPYVPTPPDEVGSRFVRCFLALWTLLSRAKRRSLTRFRHPPLLLHSPLVACRGIAAAWAGGDRGREVIDKFLPLVPVRVAAGNSRPSAHPLTPGAAQTLLAPGGTLFLVVVEENEPEEVIALLREAGLEAEVRPPGCWRGGQSPPHRSATQPSLPAANTFEDGQERAAERRAGAQARGIESAVAPLHPESESDPLSDRDPCAKNLDSCIGPASAFFPFFHFFSFFLFSLRARLDSARCRGAAVSVGRPHRRPKGHKPCCLRPSGPRRRRCRSQPRFRCGDSACGPCAFAPSSHARACALCAAFSPSCPEPRRVRAACARRAPRPAAADTPASAAPRLRSCPGAAP